VTTGFEDYDVAKHVGDDNVGHFHAASTKSNVLEMRQEVWLYNGGEGTTLFWFKGAAHWGELYAQSVQKGRWTVSGSLML